MKSREQQNGGSFLPYRTSLQNTLNTMVRDISREQDTIDENRRTVDSFKSSTLPNQNLGVELYDDCQRFSPVDTTSEEEEEEESGYEEILPTVRRQKNGWKKTGETTIC